MMADRSMAFTIMSLGNGFERLEAAPLAIRCESAIKIE